MYCTNVPCLFFKVCSMYCTRCAVCIIQGALNHSDLIHFKNYNNPKLVQYKEGLYDLNFVCVFVKFTRCLVCILHSAYLKNQALGKRIFISNLI